MLVEQGAMARRKGAYFGRQQYLEFDPKGAVPVIADVLDGNSSPCLVTYVARFSLIRAFRGYQVWRDSVEWKRRYKRNGRGEWMKPGFLVLNPGKIVPLLIQKDPAHG